MITKLKRFSTLMYQQRRLNSCLAIEEGKVTLNDGSSVKYVKTGRGTKTLLLLPGALGTAKSDFGPQLEGLTREDKLTLVSWDPPGYGESRPPNRTWPKNPNFYHRDAFACVQMMTTLGLDRFSVLGWSDGGITSLIVAAKYPKRVEKLICYAGNAYVSKKDIALLDNISATKASWWSSKMNEIYGKDYFPTLWFEWVAAYNEIASSNEGNICSELLSEIICPSLIIQGSEDSVVSNEHPDFLKKHIVNSRLKLFHKGNHNLHLKFHEEFNRTVEEFILE